MADEDVEFRMVVGEDYSAYIEWVDDYGNPIANEPGAVAFMQVRTNAGNIIMTFADVDPVNLPYAVVLGESGIVMLACPRVISTTILPGQYKCDLFVGQAAANPAVFPNSQHHRLLRGRFIVEPRVTVIP